MTFYLLPSGGPPTAVAQWMSVALARAAEWVWMGYNAAAAAAA